ncbi:MAG: PTS sugar transporter subunit IIA [Malacoplasma sp.]
MLNNVKYQILELLSNNLELSLDHFERHTNLKKRSLYQNVSEISYLLKEKKFPQILVKNAKFSLDITNDQLIDFYNKCNYFHSSEERSLYILFTAILEENNSIQHYADIFQVTRNTIIQDISALRKDLNKNQLDINQIDDLVFVAGDELKKRQKIIFFLFKMNYFMRKIFFIKPDNEIMNIINELSSLEYKCYSDVYLDFLINYFSFLKKYYSKNKLLDLPKDFDNLSDDFFFFKKIIAKLTKEFNINNEHEKKYINALLISGNHYKKFFKNNDNIFYTASKKYFNQIEIESFVFFSDKEKLIDDFVSHLFITYFRLKYFLYENYNYMDLVKTKYKKYFDVSKYNIYILEKELGITFDSFNIVLASLYSVSNLVFKYGGKKIDTLLVISNNDIYCEIFKKDLEENFNEINIIHVFRYSKDLDLSAYNNCLIISTVNLDALNLKNYLLIKSAEYDKISFRNKINEFQQIVKEADVKSPIFGRDLILIHNEKVKWEKALELSTEKLINEKCVNNVYYKNIIENTNKYGPYFIIDDDIAIPYVAFTPNVYKDGVQLTIFKKPFQFINDNRKIKILLTFSISDKSFDQDFFTKWMTFFSNRKHVEAILKMDYSELIYDFIEKHI